MIPSLESVVAAHGDRVEPALIPRALTAGQLTYARGAIQRFHADGATIYVENGHPTHGTWSVDDHGRFVSCWAGSCATYELSWIVEGGNIAGLSFVETGRGSRFDGRYTSRLRGR